MRHPLTRQALTTLAAVGLLATACSGDDPMTVPTTGDETVIDIGGNEIVLTSSLSGFDSCDTLLDHLRTEGADRVGPWGFDGGGYDFFWPAGGPDGAVGVREESTAGNDGAGGEAPAPAADLAEGVDFSGTNIQEIGVDEADAVKTDGARVVIVAGGELVVVDVASRTVSGSVAVPAGDRAELFLADDHVLLVSQSWYDGTTQSGVAIDDAVAVDIAEPGFGTGGSRTTITRIAIDDGDPRILETLSAEGDYVSARAVDGTARIIVRSNPQYNFPFVHPQGEAGEDRAEESNRAAVLESTLTDWLPGYTLTDGGGSVTDEGLLVPCTQVHAPTEFAGFGVLSVVTVDVDGNLDPATTSSVLAPGDVVYASPDSVYVATTRWFDTATLDVAAEQVQQHLTTSVHRFDITSESSAAYTASGSVDGLIRDRYSFSEHDGFLRVVTTTGSAWDDDSESFVRVLQETEGALVEVGSVGDMGNGEAVQSVRFQGDIGYVVTFRQVDPLYTLDLSDPRNPTVRGELKIPGFSSYLHPIGDGLVIGVGSDADEQTGQVTGSKVSLFDVSNLDDPREVATWVGPDSWNNVGWDTHAFTWWAPERIAVVPVQTWDNGEQWAGVVVLRVGTDTITEVGRIDHTDPTAQTGQTECSVVTGDDLPTADPQQFESEFEYMITDGYTLVLDCAQGQSPTATGFDCHAEDWMVDEAARVGFQTDGDLVICYPIGDGVPQISRSLVLPGGELWTVSSPWGQLGGWGSARLQVNDITSLDRLGALDL